MKVYFFLACLLIGMQASSGHIMIMQPMRYLRIPAWFAANTIMDAEGGDSVNQQFLNTNTRLVHNGHLKT